MARTLLLSALLLTLALPAPATAEWVTVTETILAPGLVYRELRGGAVTVARRYRVVLGSFASQRDADAVLVRVAELGLDATPESDGTRYRLTLGELPDATAAAALARRLRAAGFAPPLAVEAYGQDLTHAGGPWIAHLLEADPRHVRLAVAHATDAAMGLETTRSLARRHGALAAVNGGYYQTAGLLRGDSQGVLRLAGRLLSEPDRGRGAVGLRGDAGSAGLAFGRLGFAAELRPRDGEPIPVDGINRARGDDEVVVYTPELHRTTLTPPGGTEVVIAAGRVGEVRSPGGSSVVPCDGLVASFGPHAAGAAASLRPGIAVAFEARLLPLLGDDAAAWQEAPAVLGGGPLLLWRKVPRQDFAAESMSRVFTLARHPRTAIGARADGTVLLLAVDGRDPQRSVGMTLGELTALLLRLGAVSALNLDGGGSTTMVVGDEVRNRPSDGAGERENADAILVFPRTASGSAASSSP